MPLLEKVIVFDDEAQLRKIYSSEELNGDGQENAAKNRSIYKQ